MKKKKTDEHADAIVLANKVLDKPIDPDGRIIHYGPVWFTFKLRNKVSFAACAGDGRRVELPAMLSRHKPWVTCEACKQTEEWKDDQG